MPPSLPAIHLGLAPRRPTLLPYHPVRASPPPHRSRQPLRQPLPSPLPYAPWPCRTPHRFEKSASELAAETRHLPDALAAEGEVHLTSKEIGQMIGRVRAVWWGLEVQG